MALKSPSPMPLKRANENDPVAPGKHPSEPPRRILVVDDDSQIRQACSLVLIHHGHQVDVAADGEAGWRALHTASLSQNSYDLLITDHQMPKLSGLELVHKLRAAHLALPVIVVSGIPPINTESLQIAAVLPKPFSPEALMKTVTEVLLFSRGPRGRDATRGSMVNLIFPMDQPASTANGAINPIGFYPIRNRQRFPDTGG